MPQRPSIVFPLSLGQEATAPFVSSENHREMYRKIVVLPK